MQKIRIRFEKTGNARFISHLDLMRTMCRALRRAGISVKFTEGFNPRPHLVFGNPLSLGYESLDEVCDTETVCDENLEDMKKRLNDSLPSGLKVSDIYLRESKISDIAFAKYQITVLTDSFSARDVKKLFSGESVVVLKKSKSGECETDILPLIKAFSAEECGGKIVITALLHFSASVSLNPDNIAKALKKYISDDFSARYLKLMSVGSDGERFI